MEANFVCFATNNKSFVYSVRVYIRHTMPVCYTVVLLAKPTPYPRPCDKVSKIMAGTRQSLQPSNNPLWTYGYTPSTVKLNYSSKLGGVGPVDTEPPRTSPTTL